MSALAPHRSQIISATAVAAGVAASGLLIWQASYAAFSANTVSPSNSWSTGSVALADDDSGTAAFTASGLKPGSTGERCIAVTSTGTLPSTVKLYATTPSSTGGLSSWVDLTVVQGTGGSFAGGCSGFTPLATGASVYTGTLADFGSTATSFGTGLGGWAPTGSGSETRVFKVSYAVSASTPNSAQSSTASVGLTWEAQNS